MTAWLVRRFINNAAQLENQQVRMAYGTLGTGVGICLNLLLTLSKFLLGLFTGSLAIIADAVNNLSDAFGSIVSLVTVRMAQKPVDQEHPFGHGRLEYIGALGVGSFIVVMGLSLLRDGVGAIFASEKLLLSMPVMILLLMAALVKLWLFFFYRKLGRTVNNAALLAASKDSIGDVLATLGVLISIGLQYTFGWQADGVMSVLVALVVLKTGFDVCKDTIGLLLGERPDPQKANAIKEKLLTYDGVLGMHDLVLHDYGPGRSIASVHAEVSAKADIVAIHEMIDRAEREIGKEVGSLLCIHMDPIDTENEGISTLKAQIEAFLRQMDSRLTLHDFRLVPGQAQINLIFDCVLPSESVDRDALVRSLADYVKSLDERYRVVVQFDMNFS
ncbi:MAG: cation diffusion facilitator family transporter [Clostridia bacterium]|nr:cation diffusion facilitator family transporter [Clostridia bacterium]